MSEERAAPAAVSAIAVANAPVSYGAFELTVGQDPDVPNGPHVLDQVAAAATPASTSGPWATWATANGSANYWPSADSAWRARTWSCRIPTPARSREPWANSTACSNMFDAVRSYLVGLRPGRRSPTRAEDGRRMLPARSVREHSLGYDSRRVAEVRGRAGYGARPLP